MCRRFFSENPVDSDQIILSGGEARHMTQVLRLAAGAEVVVFDGSGWQFRAEVREIGRSIVKLAVLSREAIDRELGFRLTLGVALPKGDRQRWLVEKAVELGVTRFVPLVTNHGVAQPVDRALARLRRTVIEASKQCGRNRLMEITAPQNWDEHVTSADPDALRLLAHPAASDCRARESGTAGLNVGTRERRACCRAVGPEGGFTHDELAAARSCGWQTVALGPRILRVETAAILLTAMVTGQ